MKCNFVSTMLRAELVSSSMQRRRVVLEVCTAGVTWTLPTGYPAVGSSRDSEDCRSVMISQKRCWVGAA